MLAKVNGGRDPSERPAELWTVPREDSPERLGRRSQRANGRSIAYSIRLDPDEVATLERRAAANNLKPTVLARNLIRMGLARRGAADVVIAVERANAALEEIRAAIGC